MAAAEARAVWQRTANRYFIQEDAKRAPKLACCPSTSSLLSKVDTKPDNTAYVNDNFPLPNDKYSYSDVSSDSKWWLQSQPDYMYQRGLTNEQVNSHQFVDNQDGSSINSSSKESYEFVEMDSVELPWWKLNEKHDHMQTSLKPQMVKSSQNAVSRVEVQNVTSKPNHEFDSSKSKILEALCHSQTRARKAENAAKEALEEKEHILKLLFRQASQLLAYRQWIYLLQLENVCYQIKNKKSDPMIPPVFPFGSSKNGKLHKNMKKVAPTKGKRTRIKRGMGRYERDLGKYAVVFVMGLGIVGAGLLFGWSIGWMLI
ncbi:hypothetical protein Tco_1155835 [Tanacetum coccineum]